MNLIDILSKSASSPAQPYTTSDSHSPLESDMRIQYDSLHPAKAGIMYVRILVTGMLRMTLTFSSISLIQCLSLIGDNVGS